MNIFISEIKRQITAKRFIIYISLPIVIAIFWAWFIIGGVRVGFLGESSYKGVKGLKAIEVAAKDQNVYSGKMTEDKFQLSGEVFLNSIKKIDEEKDEIVMNSDLLKLTVYADTLISQDYRLKRILGEDLVDKFRELPKDFGHDFYEKESLYYKNLIDKNTRNEAEKELAYKVWSYVEKPYTYYGGFGVWRDGIEHIQLISFVLLILVVFFSSRIIAQDKESGLDEIISTTKGGRRKLLIAKLIIPIIMGILIYAVGMGLYIGILKYYLPVNALETSAQLLSVSILPYNLGEIMNKMILLGLVGTITTAIFTTFLSSKVRKTSMAMSITVLVLISGFLLSIQMDLSNPILKWINLSLPGSLVFSFFKFTMIPIDSVLGKAILSFKLNLIITVLIFFISLIMTSWNYVRR